MVQSYFCFSGVYPLTFITVIFSAMLRLPSTAYTKAQKIARARQIIEILGLSKVKDSRVGSSIRRGISGGERKRCAVGVELVTSPKLYVY